MLQKDDLTSEELINVKENIDKALEITGKNAMLMMVEGIYYFKTKDFNKAFTSFKTASSFDSNNEFKEEIDYWLTEVNGKLKK
jgi:Tfp pilus assembly protein PilF